MPEKLCDQIIKNKFGAKVECEGRIINLGEGRKQCEHYSQHVTKYVTGFCSIGAHEGMIPKNVNDQHLPTCKAWDTCACSCHEEYDAMFTMSETPRTAVDNSRYVPEKGTYVMVDWAELAASRVPSTDGPVTAPKRVESELPDAIPATIAREFGPTPSGRAARGELEAQVKWACDVWMVDRDPEFCTPKHISEEIAHKFGIREPSVGAIDAVLKRWVKIGFAEVAAKPTRFVTYTEEGVKLTLEGCKERFKRRERSNA